GGRIRRAGCTNGTWRFGDERATSSCRHGQADPETAAATAAFDSHLPALRLDEVLDDGQPEPRPTGLAGAPGVRPVEALEDALAVPRLDPRARVDHRQDRG